MDAGPQHNVTSAQKMARMEDDGDRDGPGPLEARPLGTHGCLNCALCERRVSANPGPWEVSTGGGQAQLSVTWSPPLDSAAVCMPVRGFWHLLFMLQVCVEGPAMVCYWEHLRTLLTGILCCWDIRDPERGCDMVTLLLVIPDAFPSQAEAAAPSPSAEPCCPRWTLGAGLRAVPPQACLGLAGLLGPVLVSSLAHWGLCTAGHIPVRIQWSCPTPAQQASVASAGPMFSWAAPVSH